MWFLLFKRATAAFDMHGYQKRCRTPLPITASPGVASVYIYENFIDCVKRRKLEFKNMFCTCVWIEQLSYHFRFFHVSFCRKQVMFSFTCLLFFPENKLHVSSEPFILKVPFTDTCGQLQRTFFFLLVFFFILIFLMMLVA